MIPRTPVLALALAVLSCRAAPAPADEPLAVRLRSHVERLAADPLEGRCAGQPGARAAADYLEARLREFGYAPSRQEFEFGEGLSTCNLIARLEGTDPAGEAVVLGAHYDHVGRAGQPDPGRYRRPGLPADDEIWNGADDNASGTAAVLEAARLLAAGPRPRRTILVIFFGAEEFKLLGSRHYVRHPVVPLDRTAAMINLDMVGRATGEPVSVIGTGSSDAWEDLVRQASADFEMKTVGPVHPGSDHYSFAEQKVPAVHLFTGFHADYHQPTDHAERLDYARMEKIARFAARLTAAAADRPERPKFQGGVQGYKRKLGVTSEKLTDAQAAALGLPEGRGGLKVRTVDAGGAGAAAGVREGDVIVSLGAVEFERAEPLKSLLEGLNAAAEGVDVALVVLREGARVPLVARWEKR